MRNTNLRLLCAAWACSRAAEWAFHVVVGVYAFNAGGAVAVGIVMFARMVPAAAVSLAGTAFADRFARERVLFAVEVVRSGLAVTAALAVAAGAPTGVVFAIAAGHAAVSSISLPAAFSLLPSIVATPEELVAANASLLTAQGVGTLAGPVLGGLVVAAQGASAGFVSTAALSAIAGVLLIAMRVEGAAVRTATGEPGLAGGAAGIRSAVAAPGARLILGVFGSQTLVRGFMTVLVVVVALDLLDLDQSWVGYLTSAPGAGALVGAVAARRLAGRPLAAPFLLGLAAWGIPIAVIGVHPAALVGLVALFIVGIGDAMLDVSGYTLLQRAVPDDVLARVFGVHNAVTLATVGIGSLAAPLLIDAIGTRATLVAVGLLLPALAILSSPRIHRIDREVLPASANIDLVRSVPMFATLSVAAAEQIASRLERLDVAAGTEVIRRGDAGDRFYILDEGEFGLARDGRDIVICERGDYFGEIALLRDVPRTATVTARTDARVYTLGRDEFQAAVTGHRAGLAAGYAVVAERMPAGED